MTDPSDHTIAERVRAEPETLIAQKGHPILWHSLSVRAIITAYRTALLAPEPPLTDEQISDRIAP